jgi:hypothetical protein
VADAVATTPTQTPVAAVAPQAKRRTMCEARAKRQPPSTGNAASPTESAELAATCRVLSTGHAASPTGHAASPTESAELAATCRVP